MDESPIAIEVQNLSKRYGSAASPESLKDMSFQVPLGKVCCLLGPNGSGKTTLLKILAGLLHPTSGSVRMMGLDPREDPRGVKSHIGWMPAEERSGFYGRLSGRQNLVFFGTLQGMSQALLDRAIGNLALQMDMLEDLDRMMLKVSSGAKQKVGLARSMLHNPQILLLDEPTRNLDPHTALRFRRLLKDHLARLQQRTILLSTHQLDEARRLADMILILQGGRIIRSVAGRDLEKELDGTSLEDFYLKTVDDARAS